MRPTPPTRQTSVPQKPKGFGWLRRVTGRFFDNERRSAESNLRHLRREVMNHYSFLFKEHDARILPELSQGVRNFDWATVTVQVNRIYLRASREHGSTGWHVSLNDVMGPWHPLDQILKKIPASKDFPCSSDHDALRYHLPEIERVLRTGG